MKFIKTPVANLYKSPAGSYFIRAKIGGRLVRKSLKTKSFEIAKVKLKNVHEAETNRIGKFDKNSEAKGIVGELIVEYLRRTNVNRDLRESTIKNRKQTVSAIKATWPELQKMKASDVTVAECEDWARGLRLKYKSTRYNGAIEKLRLIFDISIERGLRSDNPAKPLKKAKIKQKEMRLPSTDEFFRLLAYLDNHSRKASAKTARFLAYTGMRMDEASRVTPAMIDMQNQCIRIPGWEKVDGREKAFTKSGKGRVIPIIFDLKSLLIDWLKEYTEACQTGPLMASKNIRKTLRTACAAIKIHRITNHDLRHLFITRCMESGVDVKTVAEWVGHQDGGSLILKTYAHLRNEHSMNMAKLVNFTNRDQENVIPLAKSGLE